MGQLKLEKPNWLPGDKPHKRLIQEIIRVDQAGEYGAKRIYEGQLSFSSLTPNMREIINKMKAQELVHLEFFNEKIRTMKIRPSLLSPIWHVGGWLLGRITANMGQEAAMACTEAVEEVISEHYQKQINILPDDNETELKSAIIKFLKDENEHHDIAISYNSYKANNYIILTNFIKFITRVSIKIAGRF